MNALSDGRGFALRGTGEETSRVTRYYRFNYTVRTYPSGEWNAVGKQLSMDMFSSDACDVVVGTSPHPSFTLDPIPLTPPTLFDILESTTALLCHTLSVQTGAAVCQRFLIHFIFEYI